MSRPEGRPLPILIKVWAGEERHDFRTIRRSLTSLLDSDLPPFVRLILVDDCSTDSRVPELLARCAQRDSRVELWRNEQRMGPNAGQVHNFGRLVERFPEVDFYCNCDDDVLYHPGWLQRLLRVAREAQSRGIDGIFSAWNTPFRPARSSLRLETSEVLLKERQPALNWLIPRAVYERVGPFRDAGVAYDTDYTDRTIELGLPIICLRPSWVQNIGYRGAYQRSDRVRAHDYVGRRDLYLWGRDLWYRALRMLRQTP